MSSRIDDTPSRVTSHESAIKIGITGQAGFIGTHLFNTLGLYPDKYKRIPFDDNYFQSKDRLELFVKECDVIIHLAAMNRHHDPEVIYQTNIGLVRQLIDVLEKTKSSPHVLFASSTQEERDNLYGKSKKEGRELLELWADKNSGQFTGFISQTFSDLLVIHIIILWLPLFATS